MLRVSTKRALVELKKVWRSVEALKADETACRVTTDERVPQLKICRTFLNEAEMSALRQVMNNRCF